MQGRGNHYTRGSAKIVPISIAFSVSVIEASVIQSRYISMFVHGCMGDHAEGHFLMPERNLAWASSFITPMYGRERYA